MSAESFKRKLTAILSADVKGYSRLMGEDEDATIRTLSTYRELMSTLIQKHRGRVVDSPGDNLLAEFLSVVDAVRCAVEIQEELRVRNDELPENRRMEVRIGINLGDVVEEGERIYGDGVNIAARVEGLAEGGGICISGTVYDSIKNKLSLGYESMGEHTVKNIKEPVRVYRMRIGPEAAGKVIGEKEPKQTKWGWKAFAAVAVLVLVAAGLVWNFHWRGPKIAPASQEKMALPLPDKPSIAVLPFVNMSDDPKQEFFSDGLAEEIINGLSRIPDIFVIARNSSFTYKGKAVDVKQVAREMGVQYVLEGSVRKEVDHLRITAQLVDALKGYHVFSERFEGEMKNLFALQDEITIKIVGSIQGEMSRGAGSRLRGRGTTNLNAFLKFMELGPVTARGLNRDTNATMRRVAEEVIALDPAWQAPYSYLAYSYFNDVVFLASSDPRASFAKAIQTAQKAISLDDTQPRPYCVLCMVYLFMREYDKSIAAAERAVELGPNFGEAYWSLGTTLYHVSRPEEAIPYFQKAMRISPVPDYICLQGLGGSYRMLRRYDDAEATFKRLLQRFPDHLVGYTGLVNVYVETGRMEEAKAEAVEVLRINPQFSVDRYSRMLPFKEQSEVDRLVEALHKAGLK